MWKDFFYYSKSERRSVLFLVGMGILLLFGGLWIHSTRPGRIALVEADSLSLDSFSIQRYQKQVARYPKRKNYSEPVRSLFDPNTIDSVGLCRLGLPSFIAKRVISYRENGGVFHTPADFSRIYGLTDKQFHELQPYITIDTIRLAQLLRERTDKYTKKRGGKPSADSMQTSLSEERFASIQNYSSPRITKYQEGTVLDLNSADTLQLRKVPGIGTGLSKMIVAYRNRLGGYSSVSQLQEVASIDTSINRWFKVDSCIFRPLRVNRANLDQLRNHPYMNFYKAKAILEYRRKRGKIKGLSQLSMFQEFSEKDLQRLEPYLDFK